MREKRWHGDLAHNLLECAAGDIEALTRKPVRLEH
ncbi:MULTISPECIES: DUF1876 domain-containing protein [Amycolatopsis]|nr:DUF1876 domain-containing protein [Amycolatopsis bullii]